MYYIIGVMENQEGPVQEGINVPWDWEQEAAQKGIQTQDQKDNNESLKQQFNRRMQRKIDEAAFQQGREEIRKKAIEARKNYYNPEPPQPSQEEKKSWLDRLLRR
jgi:hypothetical protein